VSHDEMIRAWKDPAFRATLPAEARQSMPPNPAGDSMCGEELDAQALELQAGGFSTEHLMTLGCCQGLTSDGCPLFSLGPGGWCTPWCCGY
jgi:mersacidin/lichenicidin family type 2 lantibiotic